MFLRVVYVFIVTFWLTMITLLIRSEVRPEQSSVRTVPVAFVTKLLFQREQTSDLTIQSEKIRVGNLLLQPRNNKEDGRHYLDFSGKLQVRVPTLPRQRLSWQGQVEMDEHFTVRRVDLGFTMHEPARYQGQFQAVAATKSAHIILRSGDHRILDERYTLDENGVAEALKQLNIDTSVLDALQDRPVAQPVLTAQQSSLAIYNGRIETFLVTLQQSGQTLVEFHVNQLGQIVKATILGTYILAPDDIVP